MSSPHCVLHILHEGESSPPENLLKAARVISIRAGSRPDQAIWDAAPAVITISAPFDHSAKVALQKVSEFHLPVLGIGTGPADGLRAHVTEDMEAEDLQTMIDVLNSCNPLWQIGLSDDPKNSSAYWLGRVTDHVAAAMEHMLRLRMPDYSERAQRVVQASSWIATRLGMDSVQHNDLVYAARLRETGKLGLSDRILFTPRHMRTREDQTIYDRYPSLGARVLSDLASLKEAARLIEFQLENFDGSGPTGLISNQIPLGSRILRVAGAFEMIAAEKKSDDLEIILEVLERGRGSLFDPQLVRLMENYVHLTQAGRIVPRDTQRVKLSDLMEGMVLAEDIWSRNGIKIVSRGTRLNQHTVDVLMSLPLDASIEYVEIKK